MRVSLSAETKAFLMSHDLAVLSTISRNGEVQGAAVYYVLANDYLYILTKADSAKARNMWTHPQVALTVYDADEIKTVQLQGEARVEADLETKRAIFDKLVRPRNYGGDRLMPPVTELSAGGFMTFRIEPTRVHYTDYKENRQ